MHTVQVFNLGVLKIRRPVDAFSEVAASAFAKQILGIGLSPILIKNLLRTYVAAGNPTIRSLNG